MVCSVTRSLSWNQNKLAVLLDLFLDPCTTFYTAFILYIFTFIYTCLHSLLYNQAQSSFIPFLFGVVEKFYSPQPDVSGRGVEHGGYLIN